MTTEKTQGLEPTTLPATEAMSDIQDDPKAIGSNNFEVFKKIEGAVDYRTVSWPHAAVILLKGPFAIHIWFGREMS